MKPKAGLFSILFFSIVVDSFAAAPPPEANNASRERVRQTMLSLPLRFEENAGNFDPQVKFLARGPGYTLFLTPTETVLAVGNGKKSGKANVVRVGLVDASRTPAMRGEGKLTVPTNYFIGDDPAKWRTAVNYEQVRFESVYPGIDVLYHGKQHELEYDFEVAAGVDPSQIALRYNGVRRLRVDSDGSLVLKLSDGTELRQPKPVSYQTIDGERREVASRYAVKGRNKVVFALGKYDRAQPLVIDPVVLSYSTCIGGTAEDSAESVAVDASGHAYFAGSTLSSNFPTVNQYQTNQPTWDVVVARFDPNASGAASLLYSTYLGGNGNDYGAGLAVDENGNVYLTGRTFSSDFPTLAQYQTDQPFEDAFVTKLNTNLSGVASLVYSTYLGGDNSDQGLGIALGTAGNVFICGNTSSTNFPTAQQYQTDQPGPDAFVTKLDLTISGAGSLLYSTYLGGSNTDSALGVATGAGGRVFVTGFTSSTDFPTLNQYQGDQTTTDAFVTKLNSGLSGAASLLYSTYLGGNDRDIGSGIAVDAEGDAYVVGLTESTNFPTLNQFQTDQAGQDVFVTRLNPDLSGASSLIYSTYLGGSGLEEGRAIALDDDGNAFVTGFTDSTDFPLLDALQTDQLGSDVFVSRLDTGAGGSSSLAFSTYLGGDGDDLGFGIAVDFAADIYVVGQTLSNSFPLLNQYAGRVGNTDAFLTKYQTGPANDTCAGVQPLVLDEVVEGKTGGAINDYQLSGAACFTGSGHTVSTAAGRDVVYSFIAPSSGNYSFRVSNYSGSGNLVLYLTSFCSAATPGTPVTVTDCVGASNRTPGNTNFAAEEVFCHPVSAGVPVYIHVDEDAVVNGSTFTLQVTRCVRDVEPNNTPATTNAFQFGIEGEISPNTDVDFFLLGTFPADARIFAMVDARAANSDNFDLRVTTSISTLEYDNGDLDAPFGNLSATIAGTRLTAATPVWLRVNAFDVPPPVASRPYRLYAVAQPPGAGLDGSSATAESEPNNSTATADQATNNFFSGSLPPAPASGDALDGGSPSTDQDYFAFTVAAGDLIFLSLDCDPRRNNNPMNARLALLDENGAVILEVDDGSSTSSTGSGSGSLTSLVPFSPAEGLVHTATVSGTYYARVSISPSATDPAISEGDYLLSITNGLKLVSAVSRKTHGGAGTFDLNILTANFGPECRSTSGAHTLVFTFGNDVVGGNASITSGVGSVSGSPTFAGKTMTVNLTGVADVQKITVSLNNVTDSIGQILPATAVSMNVLAGDVDGNKTVNSTDIGQVKSLSGATANGTNFRSDAAVSGAIGAADISLVKSRSGQNVP